MAPFAANPPQGDRGVRGPRAEVMQLASGKSRARAAFAGNREDWTVFEPDRGPLDRSASSYAASAAVANRGRGLLLVVHSDSRVGRACRLAHRVCWIGGGILARAGEQRH